MITVKSAQRILRKMRRLELYFPVKMDLHRYVTVTSLITLMQRNQSFFTVDTEKNTEKGRAGKKNVFNEIQREN